MGWIDYFIVKKQTSHNTYTIPGFFHHTFCFRRFLTKRNNIDLTIQLQHAVKMAAPSYPLIYTISPPDLGMVLNLKRSRKFLKWPHLSYLIEWILWLLQSESKS